MDLQNMPVNEKYPFLPKATVIPKDKLHSPFISQWQNKKHTKKYFGRKKLYVEDRTERTAALHRSKYFLKFKHTNTRIYAEKFKSLGNLIFFATDLILKGDKKVTISSRTYFASNTHLIPWKRAFAYCKQAVYSTDEVSLYQKYMSCLKSLQIKISFRKDLFKLAKVIPNLRLVKTITLEYTMDLDFKQQTGDCYLFTRLNKLPRLQSFYFNTEASALQKEVIQKNIRAFYLQLKIPIVHVTLHRRSSYFEECIKSLVCLLKEADCLCLEFTDKNFCCNEDFSKESKNERKKLVSQSKRLIYFADCFFPQDKVNINWILSNCDSLRFLFLKMSTNSRSWIEGKYLLRSDNSKWHQSLRTVVLDFGFFYINSVFCADLPKDQGVRVYDVFLQEPEDPKKNISRPRKYFFSCQILNLMRQLRKNAVYLENMSLSLCLSYLDSKNYNLDKGMVDIFEIEKKIILGEVLEEISLMKKLKKLDLCSRGNLCDFPLNDKIMSLENLHLGFCKNPKEPGSASKEIENNWDQYLGLDNGISQMKELKIKTSTSVKIQPFGINLVTACNDFQNLQVLELIDQNKMAITFDLLYGLLVNILKSKNLRRVRVITNVNNGFYSKDSNILFPQEMNSYLQKIEKELFATLETKIRELIELELEEIMVGRLTGFKADFILYNKNLETSKKVFWTEKELKSRKLELCDSYLKILGLNCKSQNEDA